MARNSYESDINDFARAGAASRVRIGNEAQDAEQQMRAEQRYQAAQTKDEARYQDTLRRQTAMDDRAIRSEDRAIAREDRIVEGAELDNDVKRWNFKKEKMQDTNAKLLRIELDKEAIAANQELRALNAADEDADVKLAGIKAKYFRAFSDKIGDERARAHLSVNEELIKSAKATRATNEELLEKNRLIKDGNMSPVSTTIGDTRFAAPMENVTETDQRSGRPPLKRTTTRQPAGGAAPAAAAASETPAQIVARIKAGGGTKEDAAKALRDAGHIK